ncbi:hypothetical protein EDB19DRAFT_1677179 [Suillus lakei]|nr:hypothetical protein EDB19DRAFT_1677179 [Suillus lakei]
MTLNSCNTAALIGRHLVHNGIIGKWTVDRWVKGDFQTKMDRKEAIAILGLKLALALSTHFITCFLTAKPFAETA